MPTKFYLRNVLSSSAPTAGEKSANLPYGSFKGNSGDTETRSLLPEKSTGLAVNPFIASLAQTAQQSLYIVRFTSGGLAAQTIAAQTWTVAFSCQESNGAANMFARPVIYVWRPDTSAVVGFIHDAANVDTYGTEFATQMAAQLFTVDGSAVTCQAGDVLVFECWATATQSMATSYNLFLNYDGQTEITSHGQSGSESASFISAANDIALYTAPAGAALTADATACSLTSQSATLKLGRNLAATAASHALNPQAAALNVGRKLIGGATGHTLTTLNTNLTVLRHKSMVAVSTSAAASTPATNLLKGSRITATQQTASCSGLTANMSKGRRIDATHTSLTATTFAAGAAVSRRIDSQVAGLTITDHATWLRLGRQLAAATASASITSQQAGLAKTKTMQAQASGYAASVQSAQLKRGLLLSAQATSYAQTAGTAGLGRTRVVLPASTSFVAQAVAAQLRKDARLAADVSAVTVATYNAVLSSTNNHTMGANTISFAATGSAAQLLTARRLAGEVSAAAVTANQAGLARAITFTTQTTPCIATAHAASLLVGGQLAAGSGSWLWKRKDRR